MNIKHKKTKGTNQLFVQTTQLVRKHWVSPPFTPTRPGSGFPSLFPSWDLPNALWWLLSWKNVYIDAVWSLICCLFSFPRKVIAVCVFPISLNTIIHWAQLACGSEVVLPQLRARCGSICFACFNTWRSNEPGGENNYSLIRCWHPDGSALEYRSGERLCSHQLRASPRHAVSFLLCFTTWFNGSFLTRLTP